MSAIKVTAYIEGDDRAELRESERAEREEMRASIAASRERSDKRATELRDLVASVLPMLSQIAQAYLNAKAGRCTECEATEAPPAAETAEAQEPFTTTGTAAWKNVGDHYLLVGVHATHSEDAATLGAVRPALDCETAWAATYLNDDLGDFDSLYAAASAIQDLATAVGWTIDGETPTEEPTREARPWEPADGGTGSKRTAVDAVGQPRAIAWIELRGVRFMAQVFSDAKNPRRYLGPFDSIAEAQDAVDAKLRERGWTLRNAEPTAKAVEKRAGPWKLDAAVWFRRDNHGVRVMCVRSRAGAWQVTSEIARAVPGAFDLPIRAMEAADAALIADGWTLDGTAADAPPVPEAPTIEPSRTLGAWEQTPTGWRRMPIVTGAPHPLDGVAGAEINKATGESFLRALGAESLRWHARAVNHSDVAMRAKTDQDLQQLGWEVLDPQHWDRFPQPWDRWPPHLKQPPEQPTSAAPSPEQPIIQPTGPSINELIAEGNRAFNALVRTWSHNFPKPGDEQLDLPEQPDRPSALIACFSGYGKAATKYILERGGLAGAVINSLLQERLCEPDRAVRLGKRIARNMAAVASRFSIPLDGLLERSLYSMAPPPNPPEGLDEAGVRAWRAEHNSEDDSIPSGGPVRDVVETMERPNTLGSWGK